MIKKILAAIDGSEHAWKALDLATDLAKLHGAQLTVLHVVPYEPMAEALRAFAAAENLPLEEEAEARVRDQGLADVVGRTVEGKAADCILELAKSEHVDLIVMGSRGLSDARALFLGSVSHKVANLAACTCVTVK
jgi:nucleotide-binding universal stress UspA family protein